jgi:hypothetical protein
MIELPLAFGSAGLMEATSNFRGFAAGWATAGNVRATAARALAQIRNMAVRRTPAVPVSRDG